MRALAKNIYLKLAPNGLQLTDSWLFSSQFWLGAVISWGG